MTAATAAAEGGFWIDFDDGGELELLRDGSVRICEHGLRSVVVPADGGEPLVIYDVPQQALDEIRREQAEALGVAQLKRELEQGVAQLSRTRLRRQQHAS